LDSPHLFSKENKPIKGGDLSGGKNKVTNSPDNNQAKSIDKVVSLPKDLDTKTKVNTVNNNKGSTNHVGTKTIVDSEGAVWYYANNKLIYVDLKKYRPNYINPGHHDANQGGRGKRPGDETKTQLLPKNHEELWSKAIPDIENIEQTGVGKIKFIDNDGTVYETKAAKNWFAIDEKGDIHRFQNDHNQNAHWSGSEDGPSGLVVPNHIKKQLGSKRKK
jgi:hypothetical protein